jgi:hypothetical protein
LERAVVVDLELLLQDTAIKPEVISDFLAAGLGWQWAVRHGGTAEAHWCLGVEALWRPSAGALHLERWVVETERGVLLQSADEFVAGLDPTRQGCYRLTGVRFSDYVVVASSLGQTCVEEFPQYENLPRGSTACVAGVRWDMERGGWDALVGLRNGPALRLTVEDFVDQLRFASDTPDVVRRTYRTSLGGVLPAEL